MLRTSFFLKQSSPALLRTSFARISLRSAAPWKKSIRLNSTANNQHAGKDVRGGFILLPIAVAIGLFACFHHQLHIDTYGEKTLKHSYEVAAAEKEKEAAAEPELIEIDVVEVLGEDPVTEEKVVLVEEENADVANAEEDQSAAYNPETGEINWDCPCLGGMANGPCGEEFKAAFSCFVYSEAEPKGIDCIEKFKGMQDCFRQHPDVYAAELRDEEVPIESSEAESASKQEVTVVEEAVAPAAVITEEVVPVTVVEEVVTPTSTVSEEKAVPAALISEEAAPVATAEEGNAPVVEEEVAHAAEK